MTSLAEQLAEDHIGGITGKIASYILVAVLGGTTGVATRDVIWPPRPDPFTGTQGKELSSELAVAQTQLLSLSESVIRVEERQLVIIQQLGRLPPRELTDRVTRLEQAIESIKRTEQRLENALERMRNEHSRIMNGDK